MSAMNNLIIKVKKIGLTFENCESIEIDIEHIGVFVLRGYGQRVQKLFSNNTIFMEEFNEVLVEIDANENKKYDSLGHPSNFKLFDRISKYNDITIVSLLYEDGSRKDYYVDYDGDEKNFLQSTKKNSFGDLYIAIGKNLDIEYIFSDEIINDEYRRSFREMQKVSEEFGEE